MSIIIYKNAFISYLIYFINFNFKKQLKANSIIKMENKKLQKTLSECFKDI